MTTVRASAPGKAVLSGEYIVLVGAPAISVALNRRVTVTISETSRGYHQIGAPGLVEDNYRFEDYGEDGLHWQDDSAANTFSLVESVWRNVSLATTSSLDVCIDSSDFFDSQSGMKLGLGSSAAVATSLAAALTRITDSPADVWAVARTAHSQYQGGCGSGVDIATSLRGGVIEFWIDCARPPVAVGWPDGLAYRFLWSGKSAATVDRVGKFVRERERAGGGASGSALAELAADVATKWSVGSAGEILTSLADYTEALRRFSDNHDLGIFDAGHSGLVGLASDRGIVYKPCGAGAGDIGVALGRDESSLTKFCARAEQDGFSVLDVVPDWQGVAVEAESGG